MWLGWCDSDTRMTESKSVALTSWLHPNIKKKDVELFDLVAYSMHATAVAAYYLPNHRFPLVLRSAPSTYHSTAYLVRIGALTRRGRKIIRFLILK